MRVKLIGAVFVILGCTGFGLIVANGLKRECAVLRNFISALDLILSELNYRMPPLPELFRLASSACGGVVCRVLLSIARELDNNKSLNAKECILSALKKHPDLPKYTYACLKLFGNTVGTLNLSGQIKAIEAVKSEANRLLVIAEEDQSTKMKCYKTLGISAGVALVILFV